MPAPERGTTIPALARVVSSALLAMGLSLAPVVGGAAPAGAQASVLHVDKKDHNCSDSGRGTARQPYCSIAAAAATAAPGQTVRVSAGRYAERVEPTQSGRPGRRIVYTTAPGATVVIRGTTHGFLLSGKSWITVRGFTITKTSGPGIRVNLASHVRVIGNDVSLAGQQAIGLTAHGISLTAVTDALVSGNRAHHNSNGGIFVARSSSGVRITGNESFANARGYARAAAGIDVRASVGSTVARNRAYGNEDSGINIWSGSHATTAFNNVVYVNGDHGIDVHQSNDAKIVSNTVYGNVDSGIEATGALRTQISNNITADNGIHSPRSFGNVRTDAYSAPSVLLNHNLFFLSTPGGLIDWAGDSYSSLTDFQAATGYETHSIQADPAFRDSSSGDFHLTVASPAIDSADSGAPGQQLIDADGRPRTDVRTVADTGAGPRTYDDRGAYEFQP